MLRKLSLIVLCLSILTTQAMAVTGNGMKTAFDEFTYKMEVEGALTNPAARKQAMDDLKHNLLALNLSQEEMLNSALAEVKDQKVASDIRQALEQKNNMSAAESIELIRSILSKSYMNGASWNGGLSTTAVVAIMLVIIVILVLIPTGPGCSDAAYYAEHQVACDTPSDYEYRDSWDSDYDW